jgi:hypothetical protein
MIELTQIADQARINVGKFRGSVIYPESPVCGFVCDEVLDILGHPTGLKKVRLEFPDTLHFVLQDSPKNKIYDLQFKQFIYPEFRDNIPDILTIDLSRLKNIKSTFTSLGMFQEVATVYTNLLNTLINDF